MLASAPGCGSIDLAVHGGTLFWTERERGVVKSIATAGGAPKVVATGQLSPGPITADASSVFWVGGAGKTIMRSPVTGGTATTFIAATMVEEISYDENNINGVLVDDGTLYFGRHVRAFSVPTSGGMPKMLMHSPELDQGRPSSFALDATHLYQTELTHHAVSRERLDGTQEGLLEKGGLQPFAPDRIAVSQGGLLMDAIGLANRKVVWADNGQILSKPIDALEAAAATRLTESADGNDITGFVVSGDAVYFGVAVANTVQMAPLQGDVDGTVIARSQPAARQFVADLTNVYWSTADCRIMKLQK